MRQKSSHNYSCAFKVLQTDDVVWSHDPKTFAFAFLNKMEFWSSSSSSLLRSAHFSPTASLLLSKCIGRRGRSSALWAGTSATSSTTATGSALCSTSTSIARTAPSPGTPSSTSPVGALFFPHLVGSGRDHVFVALFRSVSFPRALWLCEGVRQKQQMLPGNGGGHFTQATHKPPVCSAAVERRQKLRSEKNKI